jgi:hypothetical protein
MAPGFGGGVIDMVALSVHRGGSAVAVPGRPWAAVQKRSKKRDLEQDWLALFERTP